MITHMVTPDSTSSPPNSPCGEDTIKLNSSMVSASSPATSTNYLSNFQFQQQQVQQFHLLQSQYQQQQSYQSNYTSSRVDQMFQFDNSSVSSFNPVRPPPIGGDQRSPYQNLQPPPDPAPAPPQVPPPPPPPPQQQQQMLIPPQLQSHPELQSQTLQSHQEFQSQPLQQNNFYPEYINEFNNNPQLHHPYSVFANPQAISSVSSLPNLDAHQSFCQSHPLVQHPIDFSKMSSNSVPIESSSFLYNLQNQSTDLMINQDLEFSNASFDSIGDYSQSGINLPYRSTLQPQQNQFHDTIPTNEPQQLQGQEYPHTPSHLSEPPLSASLSDVSNFSTAIDESHFYRPTSTIGDKMKSPIPTSTPLHDHQQQQHQHQHQFPIKPSPSVSTIRHKISKKSSLSRLNTSSRKNLQASLAQTLSTSTELDHKSPSQIRMISPRLKTKASFSNIKIEVTDNEEDEEDDDDDDDEDNQLSDFSQPPQLIGNSMTGNIGLRSTSIVSSTSSQASHHGLPVMNVFHHNSESTVSPIPPLKKIIRKPRRKSTNISSSSSNAKRISSKSSTDSTKTESESNDDNDNDNDNIPPVKKKHTRRRLLPRSKKGCWICRIKHLKCDEISPTCGGCAKFGLQCDYSIEKPAYVTDKYLREQKLEEVSLIRKRNQAKSKISRKKSKKDFKKLSNDYIS